MKYLLILLTIFVSTFLVANVRDSNVEKLSLNKCLLSSSKFVEYEYINKFEKAYVRVSDTNIDLVFTRGNIGTFDKRSIDYKPMLFCITSRNLEIQFLASSMRNVFIDNFSGSTSPDYNNSKVMEYLYIKNSKGTFEYKAKQIMSDHNFEKHN